MKFASKGEVLSLLHARASGKGMSRSAMDMITTPSGHRPRAVPLTQPTPIPSRYQTPGYGQFVQAFLNDPRRLQPAAKTIRYISVSPQRRSLPHGNHTKDTSDRSASLRASLALSADALSEQLIRHAAKRLGSSSESVFGMLNTNPASAVRNGALRSAPGWWPA